MNNFAEEKFKSRLRLLIHHSLNLTVQEDIDKREQKLELLKEKDWPFNLVISMI